MRRERREPLQGKVSDPHDQNRKVDGQHPKHYEEY